MSIEEFHRRYYTSNVWQRTFWLGYQILKCPLDCWIYQELIYVHRPTVIIECGTWRGGSALFFASVCELLNRGRVITIDLLTEETAGKRPAHNRITYIKGPSTDCDIYDLVCRLIDTSDSVMVVLDSAHAPSHVAKELDLYSTLVTPGQPLVVEDTNSYLIEGASALDLRCVVDDFLKRNTDFQRHEDCEKFLMTFNPGGWLQRKAKCA